MDKKKVQHLIDSVGLILSRLYEFGNIDSVREEAVVEQLEFAVEAVRQEVDQREPCGCGPHDSCDLHAQEWADQEEVDSG